MYRVVLQHLLGSRRNAFGSAPRAGAECELNCAANEGKKSLILSCKKGEEPVSAISKLLIFQEDNSLVVLGTLIAKGL
jgi:hypothetical protein